MRKASPAIQWRRAAYGFPAEGDVIVEVEVVEPGFHIFTGLAQIADALSEKLQRFHVAVRAALVEASAPLLDLPGRVFVRSVLFNPRQHLTVPLSRGQVA